VSIIVSVSVKINDGVVMAADSATSFAIGQIYEHANKIVTDVGIPYSCCNHMISDGSGFVISLHFNTPIICVTLQGRNLNDLFRKLLDDEVEWLMEFDARKWPTPGEHEPCITGIEVTHAPLPRRRSDDDALVGEAVAAKVASH
jgi:hypothetical protein